MCCSEYKNSLHEYASGGLNELEYHAVTRHLKTCDKCRKELEEIKDMKAILKSGFQKNLMPPIDLKAGIMASINLNKYKKVYKNTLGELANWGMSLVAAGLILLFMNVAPANDIVHVQNEWDNTKQNITQKISQPFSSINESLDRFTNRIVELDGITGRIERDKKGGN
ncbi:MAG TPA: zf-HC2 domain-containing protein [Candidatus Nitrosocosmicus sp.]|nr:zf-HC2 domain-containing protein [Candidatus Nitrosocosmicus sp.]